MKTFCQYEAELRRYDFRLIIKLVLYFNGRNKVTYIKMRQYTQIANVCW